MLNTRGGGGEGREELGRRQEREREREGGGEWSCWAGCHIKTVWQHTNTHIYNVQARCTQGRHLTVGPWMYVFMYVCMSKCLCVCVCVCMPLRPLGLIVGSFHNCRKLTWLSLKLLTLRRALSHQREFVLTLDTIALMASPGDWRWVFGYTCTLLWRQFAFLPYKELGWGDSVHESRQFCTYRGCVCVCL